jgi:hypothetical protein
MRLGPVRGELGIDSAQHDVVEEGAQERVVAFI